MGRSRGKIARLRALTRLETVSVVDSGQYARWLDNLKFRVSPQLEPKDDATGMARPLLMRASCRTGAGG